MLSDTCLQISQSSENNKFGKEVTGKLLWQYEILRIRAMKKNSPTRRKWGDMEPVNIIIKKIQYLIYYILV